MPEGARGRRRGRGRGPGVASLLLAAQAVLPREAPAQVWGAGEAEARITVAGTTLQLSADNANRPQPMILCAQDRLVLRFARLHLGFPMPPVLDLALTRAGGAWQLEHARLDRTGDAPDLEIAAAEARVAEGPGSIAGALGLEVTGMALRAGDPLGTAVEPVAIALDIACPQP